MIDFSAVKDYKLCSKCNRLFPETTEYFHRNKMTLSGLANKCKKCIAEYRKKYREENKEKIAEHQKEYNKKNKERLVEYRKKYYEENKEKIREKRKKKREEN